MCNLDASHVDLIPLHQLTSQHTPNSVVGQKHALKLVISLPPSGHSLEEWPALGCYWVLGDLPSYPQTLVSCFYSFFFFLRRGAEINLFHWQLSGPWVCMCFLFGWDNILEPWCSIPHQAPSEFSQQHHMQ